MTIQAAVHPGSSQKKVIEKEGVYHIYIHSQPEKGKANEDCIELLSRHFNVRKSLISIRSGHTSRKKTFEIAV